MTTTAGERRERGKSALDRKWGGEEEDEVKKNEKKKDKKKKIANRSNASHRFRIGISPLSSTLFCLISMNDNKPMISQH